MIDWLISELIPVEIIKDLIAVVFEDFQQFFDLFGAPEEEKKVEERMSEDSDSVELNSSQNMSDEDSDYFNQDGLNDARAQKIIKEKWREFWRNLKTLVGEYIAKCKKSEYDILETFIS